MKLKGVDTLYLITDHNNFYERYGWKFLCMVQGGIYSQLKYWRIYLKVLMCAQGVILMNSKHITNYKPKDFAELLGVSVKTLTLG